MDGGLIISSARSTTPTTSMKDSAFGVLFAPLPQTGFVRLSAILAPKGPIPVGKSTWWAGIKTGRFPRPLKLGPRITVWRVEDIRALIENPEGAPNERKAAR
jgi:prophage regulatory protein